jgi:UDP-2,4-diacetamido-2,4,6-trideoxy-beta-L-altropyranose hydrolase
VSGGIVAFYVRYGPATGYGHLVRSSALAQRLRAQGWKTLLFADAGVSVPAFCAAAYSELQPLVTAASLPLSWMVVDHPSPDEDLAMRLRAAGVRTLRYVDDGSSTAAADVILNQNLGENLGSSAQHGGQQLVLLGPSYATLRPAFACARPQARAPSDRSTLRRVLVTPGATDVCRVTERLLPALAAAGLAVDIVLSGAALGLDEVRRIASAQPRQVKLFVDADDRTMSALLGEADVVVGNGGVGCWERCTLGAPSIMLEMAPDQRGNIAALEAAGASVAAGHGTDPDMPARVMQLIAELRDAPRRLENMSSRSFRVCDGLGANRVAAVVDPLHNADGRIVGLRSASMADCRRVFEWQSIPETRRYARNPDAPSWEGHERWFTQKLADHRTIMTIIEVDGSPAGVVRLDARTAREGAPVYEVSIFLDPAFKGRGTASVALEAASRLVPFSWLQAFVLPENETSLRLFTRAGYEEMGDAFYLPPREQPPIQQDRTT